MRDITPIAVSNSEVHAHDLAAGVAKTFKLSKVELAGDSTTAPEYDPSIRPVAGLNGTIRNALSAELLHLESMGWHAQLSDHSIAVHRSFKNGKPRKTPDVALSYDEYVTDIVIEVDGSTKEERRKSGRPYRLTSRSFAVAKTFTNMSVAVSAFLEEAKLLAPSRA